MIPSAPRLMLSGPRFSPLSVEPSRERVPSDVVPDSSVATAPTTARRPAAAARPGRRQGNRTLLCRSDRRSALHAGHRADQHGHPGPAALAPGFRDRRSGDHDLRHSRYAHSHGLQHGPDPHERSDAGALRHCLDTWDHPRRDNRARSCRHCRPASAPDARTANRAGHVGDRRPSGGHVIRQYQACGLRAEHALPHSRLVDDSAGCSCSLSA